MGFFDSVGSFLGTAAKAVATGGISIIAPKLIPRPINTALNALTRAQFPTSFRGLAQTGLAVATRNPSLLLPSQGAQPMALNIGGILGQVGQVFSGNQNPYFQGIGSVAGLASQFVTQPVAQPVAARVPQLTLPALRSAGVVGRSFFNRYPNLATAIQGLRNMGRPVKRSQLYSMLRRFGPELLISGGILTAAAVSELLVAGPGRRRMNPGNAHALRRSLRRVEAFHKLCVRADSMRRPRGRSKPCKTGGTQFVRQG